MSQVAVGISDDNGLAYEGSPSLYGHAIWPTPFFSIASYIGKSSEWKRTSDLKSLQNAEMIFREDFFDPVARIRRGRLYFRCASLNPATWHVQRHPAYSYREPSNTTSKTALSYQDQFGFEDVRLITFRSFVASDLFLSERQNLVLILGFGNRTAIHTILDIERLANGEELISLRTQASLGTLPALVDSLIPEKFRELVLTQYEKAANAAFRDDCESVIDRCREAATAALNAKRASQESPNAFNNVKDLNDLANFFGSSSLIEPNGQLILSSAAKIIARLHARGKSVEISKGCPPLTERDAECALVLLGKIYTELNWVRQ